MNTFEDLLAEYLLLDPQAEGHVSRDEDGVFVARCGVKEFVVELKVLAMGHIGEVV